jgi:epoxyqueuosine reductase QueG
MARAGVRGLRRNLAVAIGNSGDAEARTALDEVDESDAPSLRDPMVREHVGWARTQVQRTKVKG